MAVNLNLNRKVIKSKRARGNREFKHTRKQAPSNAKRILRSKRKNP